MTMQTLVDELGFVLLMLSISHDAGRAAAMERLHDVMRRMDRAEPKPSEPLEILVSVDELTTIIGCLAASKSSARSSAGQDRVSMVVNVRAEGQEQVAESLGAVEMKG